MRSATTRKARAGLASTSRAMHFIAYGWLGMMAGIGGLAQVHYAQEVVPNALIGRELDVLAAVVLGGARLGGGRGTVLGCILGVFLVSVTQNGAEPARDLALCLQDDHRRDHPPGDHPVECAARQAARRLHQTEQSGELRSHRPAARQTQPCAAAAAATWRRKPSALLAALVAVMVFFSLLSPRFLSVATFDSVAFQLPELGLLTLAMLMPIISGGINLSVTFTANICGLTLAWVLQANGGPDAGIMASFCSARCLPSASARPAASSWGRSSPIPARIRSWSRCR